MESAQVQIIVKGVVVSSVTIDERGEEFEVRHVRNIEIKGMRTVEQVKRYLLFGKLKGVHLQGA